MSRQRVRKPPCPPKDIAMDLSSSTPDQRKAVQHLDGPLLVCAGAGTGKTFTLTQRVAWALVGNPEEGIPPYLDSIDQALVITYTNKAAAELKGRFRSALRSIGRFQDALRVDGAWVSTIHGMCSRILHAHALELGIDPEFGIALGADVEGAKTQAMDMAIRDVATSDLYQPLFAEFETLGVKAMVGRILGEAACQTRGLDAFNLGPGPTDTQALLRIAIDQAENLATAGTAKTAERASLIAQSLAAYQAAGADSSKLSDLVREMGLGRMRGEAAAELKTAIYALQDAESLNRSWDLLQLLMQLARIVQTNYQALLHSESMVDTGELIRTTLDAFDEHPEIAHEYTRRFKLIMVDEFQDTSQLQIDMIERIAGPGRTHLCTVGDSQQSIYRFQGADVGVYLKHKRDMVADGALLVELQDNFRSNSDILAFVRAVCSKPGFFEEDFLDLRAGSTGRVYHGGAPRIELAVTMYDDKCREAAIAQEARLIATRFRAFLDEGHVPSDMVILMGATTHMDAYASALHEAGIPCMAAGGSKYYASPHVQRCLSLLATLANPYDSQSMMDVLSSEVLPVSTEDLLYLSTYVNEQTGLPTRQNFAQSFLRRDRAPQEASPLLQHAMDVLKRAWRKLGTVSPSRIFLETVVDSGWFDRLATQGEQGQAIIADIVKMVRLAQDAEQAAGFDMARVANALRAASQSENEAPGVLSAEGLQAVRLMTVHSSKGLEFPIVAVTSCFTSRFDSGSLRTVVENGTVHASLMPKGTQLTSTAYDVDGVTLAAAATLADLRAKIIDVDTRNTKAERRRLFYVAATRATDALIVAMNKRRTKTVEYKEVEADLLQALFPGQDDFPTQSTTFDYGGSEPAVFTRIDVHPESADDAAADRRATAVRGRGGGIALPQLKETANLPMVPLPRRKGFFSYSSIAPHDENLAMAPGPRPEAIDGPRDDLVAFAPSVDYDKATDFGTALHRTCEWIALQGGASAVDDSLVRMAAARFANTYGVCDTNRLHDAAFRWLHSDIAAQSYAFASHQPEVPFCVQVADGCLEGEIDLLCTNGDGHAFIVDYKTGGSPTETPDQLHDKHLLQAQCYAFATLTSGYTSVELHFVRVERTDPADPAQPQAVDYAFAIEDLPALKTVISEAKAAATATQERRS